MTGKHYSIDQLAALTARQDQRELGSLRRDLNALRGGMAGLTRAVGGPTLKQPRLTTKRTTSGPSALDDLAGAAAGAFFGGYNSAAQKAGSSLAALALGQRIR